MNTDGSGQELLIPNVVTLCSHLGGSRDSCVKPWHKPSWSSDGMRITTSSERVYEVEWYGTMIFLCASAPSSSCLELRPFPSVRGPFGFGFGPLLADTPAWSPDGQLLAFNAGIWEPANFAFRSFAGREPSWSPEGTRIAFTSSSIATPTLDIYVRNANDTAPAIRLTDAPGDDTSAQWSITGKIAFVSNRDGNREIYVMNADGTGQTNVTNHPADDASPSWSPDGSQLVFQTNRDGNDEIYAMFADGSNVVNLTNDPASDTEPAWSP